MTKRIALLWLFLIWATPTLGLVFPVEKTPLTIPGLVCWFDASVTPTGSVASWTDLSGNGRHAVQGTGALQPTCTPNQQGGKNGLVFSASQYAISTFGMITSANCTVFAVLKFGIISTTGTNLFAIDGIDATNRQTLLSVNSKFAWGTNSGASSLIAADTNFHLHTMQGGTTGSYWIDGAAQWGPSSIGTLGAAGLTLGARYTLGNNTAPTFLELAYYARKLSASELESMNRYLSNKWGISI